MPIGCLRAQLSEVVQKLLHAPNLNLYRSDAICDVIPSGQSLDVEPICVFLPHLLKVALVQARLHQVVVVVLSGTVPAASPKHLTNGLLHVERIVTVGQSTELVAVV